MTGTLAEKVAAQARSKAIAARVLTQAGVIQPFGPVTLVGLVKSLRTWGMGVAGGFTAVAIRFPDRVGIVDELGELTFREIDERSNALADELAHRGVREGDNVALLARNHRGFLDAALAISKLGANVLLLNTAFAAPQLGEVCEREDAKFVIHDEEFDDLVDRAGLSTPRLLAWTDSPVTARADRETVEQLIASGSRERRTPPSREGKVVILTSGTTGTPKGAPRGSGNFEAAVALLERIPLRSGWRSHVAAPLFHTWGFAHLSLAMLLGSTVVLTRKFDPENALKVLTEKKCDSFVVIPVMLQRILRLPKETLDSYDLSRVKVVAASGSAMPGNLATEWMDQFGDTLYNIYGSTEVAWASVAQPRDMRAAPGTAGKPPVNTIVRIYDLDGNEVPTGETGRIFVGNSMLFEGYTGGGHKEVIDGLMSSGDVGRFDEDGHLFVEGRDDEMIVSGGENVFPKEVEDCLARHDGVVEVAAIGVDDDEFGKRLRAFVVLADGKKVSEDELREHVKSNLARYKVPRDFVFLDELPRNATGKVLKRELHEIEA
ncbi:AMP-binding protein [Nocardioides pocheonensis]|uniref:Acyl-CoA synthetase n=1 Tax=Nocardioides pocheonensis TaxID=661485 RepID=A0A3N0GPH2_9ACTN|nr:AMP-binding protein [Nocardioides pocheonensis]RNM13980.1 acyl-CoA synthetase [Nocardioides pocheonensis]